jgi:hypothetical protein
MERLDMPGISFFGTILLARILGGLLVAGEHRQKC